MAVTVRQVAARAGVSPVVVSRVLHNKALAISVTEATAERVREAARDLGYKRNVAAVNFRNGQTFSFGILHGFGKVMPSLEGGTHYLATLLDGVVEGAFKHGYSVTLCPKLLGPTSEDGISDGRFDGLIIYNVDSTERDAKLLGSCQLPLVIVHGRASGFGSRLPSVICDNKGGISLAVDHLYSLGHRKIVFAEERWLDSQEYVERRDAFKSACEQRGLDPEVCSAIPYLELERVFTSQCTAVVAHQDGLAGEIYSRAGRRGVQIPDDLSIVGFDSTSYCQELRPALTSVRQPLCEMGRAAAELLVGLVQGRLETIPEMVFPCGLDVRESTRAI